LEDGYKKEKFLQVKHLQEFSVDQPGLEPGTSRL